MRTVSLRTTEIPHRWLVVDAEGQTLGRLASEVAVLLQGKGRPTYTPHVESGDHVVVINAEKVHLSGKKAQTKTYTYHSSFYSGFKSWSFRRMREKHPDIVIQKAVWGMLPKGRLGRKVYKNLHVYAGPKHPHSAQMPEAAVLAG